MQAERRQVDTPGEVTSGNLNTGLSNLVTFETLASTSVAIALVACALGLLAAIVQPRRLRALGDYRSAAGAPESVRPDVPFRDMVLASPDATLVVDADATIVFASPAIEQVAGVAVDRVPGLKLTDLVHADDVDGVIEFVSDVRAGVGEKQVPTRTLRFRREDGQEGSAEVVAAVLEAYPGDDRIILNCRDTTPRPMNGAAPVERIQDVLTGLPGRAILRDRLEMALARTSRNGSRIAVLLFDLDDFHSVNAELGRAAGDSILRSVAARLLNATRGSDTVARLDDDEFAVLLEDVPNLDDVTVVADRILGTLRPPFTLDARDVWITASLGVARSGDGQGVDDLLRNAEIALRQARAGGNGAWQVFEPPIRTEAIRRGSLEEDFRGSVAALDRPDHGFGLIYQPIVDLGSGEVVGVEPFIRWCHPTLGMIPPGQVLPLAEDAGLASDLGRWIIRETCREIASWEDEGATQLDPTAVNDLSPGGGNDRPDRPIAVIGVSAATLNDPGFTGIVANILTRSGLEPDRLVLAVAASVAADESAPLAAAIASLREIGVRFAVGEDPLDTASVPVPGDGATREHFEGADSTPGFHQPRAAPDEMLALRWIPSRTGPTGQYLRTIVPSHFVRALSTIPSP